MFLTAPSRSADGEQSDPALTSIDRPPDMGDAVCNLGHGQELPEEASAGQERPGWPQVWTRTSPTQSFCDMMIGVELRRLRDGSESPRGQLEPAD